MYTHCMDSKDSPGAPPSRGYLNPGGGVEFDILEFDDGTTLIVADGTVSFYRSVDDFWAETEDGSDGRRTVTLLRETTMPLDPPGAQ